MRFDLTNEIDVSRFREKVEYHIRKKTKRVELTEKRTEKQNSYLHLILGWFALESGNQMEFVKQKYFKELVNPDIFVIEKDDKYAGRIKVLRSSADVTSKEMTDAIDKFRNWSSMEAGIYLPEANENQFLAHIQEEMNRIRQYL